MWCIKAAQDAAFVCQMERVLDVNKRPFDPSRPLICMDETTKQCTKEVREPIKATSNHPERYDGEYERNGVGHLLLFYAPLENWRSVTVADNHTGIQWAECVRHLLDECYPQAERVTLVMNNLSTHAGSSLYSAWIDALPIRKRLPKRSTLGRASAIRAPCLHGGSSGPRMLESSSHISIPQYQAVKPLNLLQKPFFRPLGTRERPPAKAGGFVLRLKPDWSALRRTVALSR